MRFAHVSTVTVHPGSIMVVETGSMMMAGLISVKDRQNLDQVPGLKKLPILGALFQSRDFLSEESELVVIVTPYLVDPYAEKTRATPVPKQANNPLAKAFAANIRRNFDIKDEEIFVQDETFGYLLN